MNKNNVGVERKMMKMKGKHFKWKKQQHMEKIVGGIRKMQKGKMYDLWIKYWMNNIRRKNNVKSEKYKKRVK